MAIINKILDRIASLCDTLVAIATIAMFDKILDHKTTSALVFSILYVGVGTLAVCSMYPDDPFFWGTWSVWGLLITMPVTCASFAYRFTESHHYSPVFRIQAVMLVLTFLTTRFLLFLLQRRRAHYATAPNTVKSDAPREQENGQ
jgi:hypothetical protein